MSVDSYQKSNDVFQIIKLKCEEFGNNLLTFGEQFTSQTCTRCGNIKSDLKNANTYNCIKCNLLIDRDMLGARNIFLRNIINL
jgi:transposase